MIARALGEAPARVRRVIERLCAAQGVGKVGEAVGAVFMARSALMIQGQAHGTVGDPGGAEKRRRIAIRELDDAIANARNALYGQRDEKLLDWLATGAVLTREAARQAKAKPRTGRRGLGRGRRPLEQLFRDLGASKAESETIVTAVRGQRADNIPDPPSGS